MEITLPRRSDGQRLELKTPRQTLLIIGRNGAGKSRFTESLVDEMAGRSVSVSAIPSIYKVGENDDRPGSIDNAFARLPHIDRTTADTTRLQRMVMLLMQEEVTSLLDYKISHRQGKETEIAPTRLDKVIAIWQEIFPQSRLMAADGATLSIRDVAGDLYSASRLSAGEKAVLYYAGAVLLAPQGSTLFVDNPTALLHPSVARTLWTRLEALRPDCSVVYTTHDLDFASSRADSEVVWVKSYDKSASTWEYDILPRNTGLPDEIYLELLGARRPVLFIEGDDVHSIDAKLYALIFEGYSIKALGSCNKVIESVRSFNDLQGLHHLDSYGIVDRDRREPGEVEYLNSRRILVPDVAEVENLLMLDGVVRAIARAQGRDEARVSAAVRKSVIKGFESELRAQALMHTRHKVKKVMEYRVDGRFNNINDLERHIDELVKKLNPRGIYEGFCSEFRQMVRNDDYEGVLRVYNRKTMIASSNVASVCGLHGDGKQAWVKAVLQTLAKGQAPGQRIRRAILDAFGLQNTPQGLQIKPQPNTEKPS